MRIFEVYEIEWPSRHIKSPAYGLFTTSTAADNYVRDCFTPKYDRHMVIVETEAHDIWPLRELPQGNVLTYFHQHNGEMILEIL